MNDRLNFRIENEPENTSKFQVSQNFFKRDKNTTLQNSSHYYIFMTNHEYDMVWLHNLAQTANNKRASEGVMNMGILAKLYRQARLSIMEVSSRDIWI